MATRLLVVLLGTLLLPPSLFAEPVEVARWGIGREDSYRGIAVGAGRGVVVTGGHYLQGFTNAGELRFTRHYADEFLAWPHGVVVDADGNIFVANNQDHGIYKFSDDGTYLAGISGTADAAPFGLALGTPAEDLFAKANGRVLRFGKDGVLKGSWESGGSWAIAIDAQGFVYTASSSRLRKFTPAGELVQESLVLQPDGQFGSVHGMTVDAAGRVYLVDGSGLVRIYDDQGRYRMRLELSGRFRDITLDDREYIYLLDDEDDGVRILGPLGALPPPPPPPPPVGEATRVILHLQSPGGEGPCGRIPASVQDVVTSGDAEAAGISYFVYVLLTPGSEKTGLAGVQMGIDYHGMGNQDDAIKLLDWTTCGDLEFPEDAWPASGTGNTITWVAPGNCQMKAVHAAGYFYLTAYASATMAVVPHPATGLLKTANCTAMELLPDQTLGLDAVGWVSMGRGAIGADTDGCNPATEPCLEPTVPVRPTTWGKIKSRYVP